MANVSDGRFLNTVADQIEHGKIQDPIAVVARLREMGGPENREHITGPDWKDCWCDPTVQYVSPASRGVYP